MENTSAGGELVFLLTGDASILKTLVLGLFGEFSKRLRVLGPSLGGDRGRRIWGVSWAFRRIELMFTVKVNDN